MTNRSDLIREKLIDIMDRGLYENTYKRTA